MGMRTWWIITALLGGVCPILAGEAPKALRVHLYGGHADGAYDFRAALETVAKLVEANAPGTFDCHLFMTQDVKTLPGLDEIDKADLVVDFVRRLKVGPENVAKFKGYLDAGKPLVGLRTACHGFEDWKGLDRELFHGSYSGHAGPMTTRAVAMAKDHPILRGISDFDLAKHSPYHLKITGDATLLLNGESKAGEKPLAWTTLYGEKKARVFFGSFGSADDLANPSVRRMLVQAVFWALDRPAPDKVDTKLPGE